MPPTSSSTTNLSTNRSSRIKVFDLEFASDHYYIKRPRVVEQIQFDNRTFYAKFERIEEPLSPLLLSQHLHKQYTIAVPLVEDGKTHYLVLEYKGNEALQFAHLARHLFHTMQIETFYIYRGREPEKVQVFIPVSSMPLKEAESMLNVISEKLAMRLPKRWKTLPSTKLPDAYNIVTLPYAHIE